MMSYIPGDDCPECGIPMVMENTGDTEIVYCYPCGVTYDVDWRRMPDPASWIYEPN